MKLYDESTGGGLKRGLDRLVMRWPGVRDDNLFGCPAYRADGTLFAVVTTGAVALTRLPAPDREELEGMFQTRPFGSGERQISRWVNVRVDHDGDLGELLPYIESSYKTALAERT
jgi:hypothetical protein